MAEKKNSGHLMPAPAIRQNSMDNVSNSTSDLVSDTSDWKATKKQAAFLDALAKIGLNRTIRAVCKEAECDPSSYHLWMKQRGFLTACSEVAHRIIQTAVPMTLSAMGQKAASGDTSAARLILQTAGLVGSGGTEVHIGDRVNQQLNQYQQRPGQGQHQYGDHRDFVLRATDAKQFEIIKAVSEKVAAEIAAAEAKGEPGLTDQEHLLAIKLASEKVMAEDVAAGQGEVIDVTPVQSSEAD